MKLSISKILKKLDNIIKNTKTMKSIKWYRKYYDLPILDLYNYMNDNEKSMIKELGVIIENKIYTEYEFDKLDAKLFLYYPDRCVEGIEEPEETKELPEDISFDEYVKFMMKLNGIPYVSASEIYNLQF